MFKRLLFVLLFLPSLALAQSNQVKVINSNSSPVPVSDAGGTITVDGTVAATQSGSWTNACTQSGSWVLSANSGVDIGDVTVNNATLAVTQSGTWDEVGINDSGNSITVDGTVAATQSGTWSNRLTDGTLTASVRDTGTSDSLNVAITDASGNQITSFGGGTQYTEADTDATITGTALMWEDTSDTLRAASAAKPLPVNVVAGGAGDGAIQDGSNSAIEATVFDYANSNPLACRLTDTNGDYVSVGGGTQYTEDVASASDPVGTQLIARRRDSLSTETTTDADNTAVNSTGKGELYVKHVDAIPVTDNAGSLTVDGTVAATQSGTWNINNVSGTVSLPTGAATLAEQQTQSSSLSTIEASVGSEGSTIPSGKVAIGGFDGTNLRAPRVFDGDSGAGTQYLFGTNLRKIASGGTVEAGTSSDPLRTDPTGTTAQPVTDNGGSLTIDGTVAATQSGTWILGANSGVDIGDVTLNNASVAVTQSGTWDEVGINDSGNSITVDGTLTCNAGSGTLTTSDTATLADDAAFTPATSRVMMAGFEFDDTTPDSVNEGDGGAARMSANRNVYTTIRDAAGNERGVNVNASNQMSVSVDNTVTVASHNVTNAGTFATQESGALLTSSQLIDDGIATTGSAVPAKGMQATGTDGTNARALKTDTGGELQIDVLTLPALAAGTNNIGDVDVLSFPDNEPINVAQMNGVAVTMGNGASGTGVQRVTIANDSTGVIQQIAGTAGGLTPFKSLDLDETEEEIKASAGQVYGYHLFNAATSTRYFKFYNATAANVTVGTTTPVLTLPIPAGAAANVSIETGIAFGTAITAACTTGLADNDTGAPAANECVANIYYK